MPVVYENIKRNYPDVEAFKEKAIKTINEQHGRSEPYDIFDFSETKDKFKCVAYRENEADIPEEQEAGEPLSDEAAASAENADKAEDVKASVTAKKLAEANKVDLSLVTGTGIDGNITKFDVQKYIDANKAPEKDNADDQSQDNVE